MCNSGQNMQDRSRAKQASVKEPYPRNMVLVVSVGDRTVSEQILQ